jgi:hypothetical protein
MTIINERLHGVEFTSWAREEFAGPFCVPAEHLDNFCIGRTNVLAERVYFRKPSGEVSWSWGKLWWSANTQGVCRIGAGAYGDATVWESPRAEDHKWVYV